MISIRPAQPEGAIALVRPRGAPLEWTVVEPGDCLEFSTTCDCLGDTDDADLQRWYEPD